VKGFISHGVGLKLKGGKFTDEMAVVIVVKEGAEFSYFIISRYSYNITAAS
jgi:hypothetical protein